MNQRGHQFRDLSGTAQLARQIAPVARDPAQCLADRVAAAHFRQSRPVTGRIPRRRRETSVPVGTGSRHPARTEKQQKSSHEPEIVDPTRSVPRYTGTMIMGSTLIMRAPGCVKPVKFRTIISGNSWNDLVDGREMRGTDASGFALAEKESL